MSLRLYNTLTRKKEEFRPLDADNVRMYVCGPTVYDFAHIGNARPAIVFDVLFRLLRHVYGEAHVKYVRNITDVDDKINARAARDYPGLPLNEAIRKVTELTEAQYHEDVDALGCLRPTVEPRATEHIGEMKALIEKLVESGHAYVAEDHVLFDVPSMPKYGELARRSLDEMQAGARVDVAPYKKDAMDFVLWKPSKPGEPAWESPCGIETPGRPGWHIECSAMAWKHLGEQFDIHGGGIDLVFPHHENEVAQTCCAFHEDRMAQVWMHNGFLQVEGEKMSKSLGNFITIRELLDEWPGEALRFNMIRTHYRQPINWTKDGLAESCDAYFEFAELAGEYTPSPEDDAEFVAALQDDLNTPEAIARLYALKTAARQGDIDAGAALAASWSLLGFGTAKVGTVLPTFRHGASVEEVLREFMGIFPKNYLVGPAIKLIQQTKFDGAEEEADAVLALLARADRSARTGDVGRLADHLSQINALIVARAEARAARNWAEADRIRDELAAMGIALKDAKDPATGELVTTWEIAR